MRFLINIFAFLNLIVVIKIAAIRAQINMTNYHKLPPLYTFDNYDYCLSEKDAVYCVVFAEVQPNNYSDIWFNINKLSNDLFHHYRHENLFFGVCLEQCNQLFDNLSSLEIQNYNRNKTLENEVTEFYQKIYKREEDRENRLKYQNVLNVCLNYKFQQRFNLSLTTSVEYCEVSQTTRKFDLLDIVFCIIVVAIIFFNITSSLYDYRLKRKYPDYKNNDFYKNKHEGYNYLLSSFSICRNYYRIVSADSTGSDLSFTYAFRCFSLLVVVLIHCGMALLSIQIENTEFLEKSYYKPESMIFANGSAIIQIFFVLASFFFKLNFDDSKQITPETSYKRGILVYIKNLIKRYLRFLPSLIMVILFNATLLIRLGDGPFWRHVLEPEYAFCREYWWKNVFMVNNFMLENSCGHHLWYLAADMQLYAVFLFAAILTSKFTLWKRPIYIIFGILAFLVPGVLTYFYKLEAIHVFGPEAYRYFYFKDFVSFYLTYLPSYCNIGGYLVGFITAEIYQKNIRLVKHTFSKYRGVMKFEITLLAIIVLIGFGLPLSGNLVINIEKPSIWLSLYAGLYRNMWAIYGGFILLCMLLKLGWIAYEIASLPVFRIMGRISFQSYLWHVSLIRIMNGFYRQPIYLNEFDMACKVILTFLLTNCIAFIMALFVEYPIGEIVNSILKAKKSKNLKCANGNDNEMKSPNVIEINK